MNETLTPEQQIAQDKKRAYQYAYDYSYRNGNKDMLILYHSIVSSGTNDYSPIINRIRPLRRPLKNNDYNYYRNREIEKQNKVSNAPAWYDEIRKNVCKGISTKTLSPELQDKFWALFNERTPYESDLGYQQETDVHGKYFSALNKGNHNCGHKVSGKNYKE